MMLFTSFLYHYEKFVMKANATRNPVLLDSKLQRQHHNFWRGRFKGVIFHDKVHPPLLIFCHIHIQVLMMHHDSTTLPKNTKRKKKSIGDFSCKKGSVNPSYKQLLMDKCTFFRLTEKSV